MEKKKDYAYGMDKDHTDKMRAKHDPDKQMQAQAWIEAMTGKKFAEMKSDVDENYHENLKDGTLLIKVLKKINEEYGGKYNIAKTTKRNKIKKMGSKFQVSKCKENIEIYTKTCKQSIGKDDKGKTIKPMSETDLFVTVDLYDNHNMDAVTDQVHCLGGKVRKLANYDGPMLGVKQSSENVREFTEEQKRAGRKVVPLQNAGAIHVEKNASTDKIIKSKEQSVDKSGISQQNSGGIAYDMKSGLDSIDKSGGQKSVDKSGVSQQNVGADAVKLNAKLDAINRNQNQSSSSEPSQFNMGSIKQEHTSKQDSLTRANN